MSGFIKYITDTLAENNIISNDEVPILNYGIEVFILSVVEVLSIIIISALVGNFIETLLYFIAFIPLRIYVGGYHADTRLKCYMILIGVYFALSIAIKYIPQYSCIIITVIGLIYSGIMVLFFSPIKSHIKNRSEDIKKKYRKISIVVFIVQTIIIAVLYFKFGANIYGFAFSLGQLSATLSMLAAIIKNYLRGRGEIR